MWSYPQYQHESVEGNVGLEFNVHRLIPYQSMHPYLGDNSDEIEVALKLNPKAG